MLAPSENVVIRNRHLKIIFPLLLSPPTLTTSAFEHYHAVV